MRSHVDAPPDGPRWCNGAAVERPGWYSPAPMTSLHAALLADRARPRLDVARILHSRSIAVFGASDSTDKFGGRIMSFLVRHGFAGDIYPISLRHAAVLGRRAYPAIAAVPTPP
ncbi:MAG: CoA-binding protein, partial [Candidatus Rokuibacteriota bacterium]